MVELAFPYLLEAALERLLYDQSPKELVRLAQGLSQRYRDASLSFGARTLTPGETLAYAASRMPATYAALEAVLSAVRQASPFVAPKSMLDVGSGPGTAIWASVEAFPSLERATAIEQDPAMRDIAKTLMGNAVNPVLRHTDWHSLDLVRTEFMPHDLVVASYVMGELAVERMMEVAERLWSAAQMLLVVIEPGTPQGFQRIRQIRTVLLNQGAQIVAPCPHDGACPMVAPNWCHFAVRVARSRRHRQMKGGEAPYEDEKYAYMVVGRLAADRRLPRVLRHPQIQSGRIQMENCGVDGLSRIVVTKKDGDRFRRARKIKWGDTWEE